MVIALLTTDNRQDAHQYGESAPRFGTAPEALLQGFAALPEVRVHVVSCTQQPMRSPEKLADNIWFHSLDVPKRGWLRTGYQGCIRAVRRKLREIQPDLVHGQGTERDCALSAIFSGYPNVLTLHGNLRLIAALNGARPFSYQWLAARLEQWTVPRTDGVVCITRYTERAVDGLARRTWVLPNAVDASFFDIVRSPAEARTLLCVGHITSRKNQNRFIEALDPLAAGLKFNVLFLGAAAAHDEYAEKFFHLLQTRPWCRHGGMASRAELKQHLAAATALVLPSLEDNCPMVVLEAMAAGVPVVAARVGGVPELLEEGRTGVMFDPLEEASMTGAVRRLLEERGLPARLAAEGKREAQARFHPERIARRHVEIYTEVLRSRA